MATHCCFIGYFSNQKGYRCRLLATKHIIISRHVHFNEHIFPFSDKQKLEYTGQGTCNNTFWTHTIYLSAKPPLLHMPNRVKSVRACTKSILDPHSVVITRACVFNQRYLICPLTVVATLTSHLACHHSYKSHCLLWHAPMKYSNICASQMVQIILK